MMTIILLNIVLLWCNWGNIDVMTDLISVLIEYEFKRVHV